jgi:hypothetical protein
MTESACHVPTTKRRRIDWLLTLSAIAITMLYVMHWQFAHAISGSLHIAAHAVFELTNIIWWGIFLGIVMIAILGRIPREFVMSALLDLCNHGVLMVGSRLYERGASIGQVIAFLVSSPWNSISLTIILIALIGVPWTLAFVTFSMIIAIITGVIFDLLVQRRVLPENPVKVDMPAEWRFWPEANHRHAYRRD